MSYSGAETSETFNNVHRNVSAADLLRNIHSYGNFQDFFTSSNIAGNKNSQHKWKTNKKQQNKVIQCGTMNPNNYSLSSRFIQLWN